MIDLTKIKVVAADDGQAWLCVPVDVESISTIMAKSLDTHSLFRGLKHKIRTAEIARFRESLADSLSFS